MDMCLKKLWDRKAQYYYIFCKQNFEKTLFPRSNTRRLDQA